MTMSPKIMIEHMYPTNLTTPDRFRVSKLLLYQLDKSKNGQVKSERTLNKFGATTLVAVLYGLLEW